MLVLKPVLRTDEELKLNSCEVPSAASGGQVVLSGWHLVVVWPWTSGRRRRREMVENEKENIVNIAGG
jgi:hypothetical protein